MSFINAFAVNTLNNLQVTSWDGTTRNYTAQVVVPPMLTYDSQNGNVNYVDFRVELLCEQNFISDSSTITATTGLAIGGGFAIPFILPLSWSLGSSNICTILNSGDYEDYPSITIYGPVLSPVVQHLEKSNTISFPGVELFTGDYITIQYLSNGISVLKNGTTPYYQYMTGNLSTLQIGNNNFQFGASRNDASALLKVQFINKRRSQ